MDKVKVQVQDKLKAFRIPIIGVIVLIGVWFLFFRSNGGYISQKDFEDKIKDLSNGKVTITDSKIDVFESGKGEGLYTAKWNGFIISTGVNKSGKLENKFAIMTKQAGYMDEIAIGQYHELMTYMIRISNPKLSVDEVNLLVDNELNFNQQILTGEKHTTSKGDRYYQMSGGEKPINFFMFMIMDEEGFKAIKDK